MRRHYCEFCGKDVTDGGAFYVVNPGCAVYFCVTEECVTKALEKQKEIEKMGDACN